MNESLGVTAREWECVCVCYNVSEWKCVSDSERVGVCVCELVTM